MEILLIKYSIYTTYIFVIILNNEQKYLLYEVMIIKIVANCKCLYKYEYIKLKIA